MRLGETLVLYLLVGGVRAAAMPRARGGWSRRCLAGLGYALSWPFFAPNLLALRSSSSTPLGPVDAAGPQARLRHAKLQLTSAIEGLGTAIGLGRELVQPQVVQIETIMATLDRASD